MRSYKSAISLSMKNAVSNPLARNRFRSELSVRPMHLFGLHCDHDYYFRVFATAARAWTLTPTFCNIVAIEQAS